MPATAENTRSGASIESASIDALGTEITELCTCIYAATYRLLVLIREFDERMRWRRSRKPISMPMSHRPRPPTATRSSCTFPRKRHAGCNVTAPGSWSLKPRTVNPYPSAASPARFRLRFDALCASEIGAAASRAARIPDASTATTSGTGPTVARPASTISCSYVASIIAWCTKAATAESARSMATSNSRPPMNDCYLRMRGPMALMTSRPNASTTISLSKSSMSTPVCPSSMPLTRWTGISRSVRYFKVRGVRRMNLCPLNCR